MPESYVISTSTVVEEFISTVHTAPDTKSLPEMGEQVLQDALNQAGVSIAKLELCYWGGEDPYLGTDIPSIQIRLSGASTMAAVFSAARTIIAGDANIVAAGGVGQFDARGSLKKLVRLLSANKFDETQSPSVHPVKGSGALLLASTEAVGIHNLTPNAQIAARVQVPFDKNQPILCVRQAVLKVINRAEIDPSQVGEVIIEPYSPLKETWLIALETENTSSMNVKSLGDHAGEAQGLRMISQLITDLHTQDINFGMILQAAWDGTLLAGVIAKI